MENKRYFSFELDFMDINKPPKRLGNVKQLDGTHLEIFLLNDALAPDLSGCSHVRLYAKKPNGTFVYQQADIFLNPAMGTINIQCKNSIFSAPGEVVMECELYDVDGYVMTTPNFTIGVIEKISSLEDITIGEANEIEPLAALYEYVEEKKAIIDEFSEVLEIIGEQKDVLKNICVLKAMMENNLE